MAGELIRPIETIEEMRGLEELQRRIWPGSELDVVPAHLLITLAHNGGIVLGAFADAELVGFVMGFLGVDPATPDRVAMARLKHCSHMLGVLPEHRNKGLGFQLKLAQRRQVIDQGVRLTTWTFDPLQSRNAHLNIRKLGALCRSYVRDAYGRMRDDLNEGLASDRFQVEWWVTSSRVETRIRGSRPPLDLANFLAAGASKVNPASLGPDNLPRPAEAVAEIEGTLILLEIPPDIDAIKDSDMGLALAWRAQTRQLFEQAFERGYIVTDFVHFSGEQYPRSYYVLSHGESTLGA